MPGGLVDEERGQWHIPFGSSDKTRAVIVEARDAWWAALAATAQGARTRLQSNMENGPERSGRRTPCLHRLVAFGAALGKPIPRRYSPPSHSKSHPIERCGGIFALHGNGTTLVHGETMVEWAKRRTWKGMHPIVARSRTADQQGVALRQRARHAVASRLVRHPELPQWDILIHPVSAC